MDSTIIFCAKYLVVAILVIAFYAWLRLEKNLKLEFILAFIVAGIMAGILTKLAGKLFYDPRPFVTHHVKPLVLHAADNGFPSEHTVLGMTVSALLYQYNRRLGVISFILALIVGIARVAAHIHSPIDILGGILIGLAAGCNSYLLVHHFYRQGQKTYKVEDKTS